MIINRKYEWLGILYERDKLSRKVIDDAFAFEQISNDRKEELLSINHYNISAFLNIGCGIPGNCYSHFMREFEKLDATDPYDNGMTFKNVSSIEFETSKKGTAIQMRFVCQQYGEPYRIVGFAAIENKDGRVMINKGWPMSPSYEFG